MAIIKSGKVVIILAGRHAGKKAVVIKNGAPAVTHHFAPSRQQPPPASYHPQSLSRKQQRIDKMAIIKSGKVVIILAGRHAGKKAVVIKNVEDGNADDKRFSHCLVAGIARGPRKVTRGMSKKKVEKRSRTMKPFVKYINVRHVFPTRYQVDMDLKKVVDEADLVGDKKVEVKKKLKKIFEDRYLNQKQITSEKKAAGSSYFFQKLRF
eukprot:CAMPEP_0196255152 /NCGR_PEP_ID=MMETSP0913-20130531/55171_1 /TAXON_ID=49265 /ORGANISM="Thalassiosira rotula, Strain GSO102" /LENGTH=207 /DNA_ID=CAMNT_0041542603 /DNA_START=273 /DNA_END=896 /DNA_ORIENTATION=+